MPMHISQRCRRRIAAIGSECLTGLTVAAIVLLLAAGYNAVAFMEAARHLQHVC
jgi:hypothetical protein